MITKQELPLDATVAGETYEQCHFDYAQDMIKLDRVHFINCTFEQKDFKFSEWLDCTLTQCRLPNADFSNSLIYRTKFMNCQLTGVNFTRNRWHDSTVSDCQGMYLIMAESILKNCQFNETKLTDSSFQSVRVQSKLVFSECELSGADFTDTALNHVDISKANFESLTFTPSLIRGLKINSWQAAMLLGEMGVDVAD